MPKLSIDYELTGKFFRIKMKGAQGSMLPQYMAAMFNNGIDHRNESNYYTSVGSADFYKNFLWKLLDSGAIVPARHPRWALSAQRGERDKITNDITSLMAHENTGSHKWWHYFELVRAGAKLDRHEYHIILNEELGGLNFN